MANGTFAQVLSDLKDYLDFRRESRNNFTATISEVKDVFIGLKPKIARFPAIVLIPDSEVIVGILGGGEKYYLERTISIHLYQKKLPISQSVRDLMDTWSDLRDAIRANPKLIDHSIEFTNTDPNYVFRTVDVTVGEASFGEGDYKDSTSVQHLSFPVTYLQIMDMPTVTKDSSITAADNGDIVDQVYSTISADSTLSYIKKFNKTHTPPQTGFPALSVNILGRRTTPQPAWERRIFDLQVVLWDKLQNGETVISNLTGYVEDIRDIILKNYKWGGKIKNTTLSSIQYGTFNDGEETRLFSVVFSLALEGHKTLEAIT